MNDQEMAMSPWTLTKIGHADEVIRLKIGITTVGRTSKSDIQLTSPTCSRHHCEIEADEETVTIRDFSSNGVFVNDLQFVQKSVVVKHNDRIGFGCENNIEPENFPIYFLKYKTNDDDIDSDIIEIVNNTNHEDLQKNQSDNQKSTSNADLNIKKSKEDLNMKNSKNCEKSKIRNEIIIISDDDNDNNDSDENDDNSKTKTILVPEKSSTLSKAETDSKNQNGNINQNVKKNQSEMKSIHIEIDETNVNKISNHDNKPIAGPSGCSKAKIQKMSVNDKSLNISVNKNKIITSNSKEVPKNSVCDSANVKDKSTPKKSVDENQLNNKEEINLVAKQLNSVSNHDESVNDEIQKDNQAEKDKDLKLMNGSNNKNYSTIYISDDDDEENINLQMSQSYIRDIKQEIIDFDYQDSISINDKKFENQVEINSNIEKSKNENEVVSPLFTENEDEDEDDGLDENVLMWMEKLSQSQSQTVVKEEKQEEKQEEIQEEIQEEKQQEKQEQKEEQKREPEKMLTPSKQSKNEKIESHEKRKIPEIIEAPFLPKRRERLKGVSVTSPLKASIKKSTDLNLKRFKNKTKIIDQEHDLKRKWYKKPHLEKLEQKEKTIKLKEERKQKLKELAEEQVNKRKLNEDDDDVKIVKRPRVKVTMKNRGAFLTEEQPSTSKKLPVIPKLKSQIKDSEKSSTERRNSVHIEQRRNSICTSNEKLPIIPKLKPQIKDSEKSSTERRNSVHIEQRHKSICTSNEKRSDNDPSNSSSNSGSKLKLTKSMHELKSPLKSSLKRSDTLKKKLRVKFNLNPQIHYIPRETTNRNVDVKFNAKIKDASAPKTFTELLKLQNDQKQNPLNEMQLIDYFDEILFEVLEWNPNWLDNHKHEIQLGKNLLPILHKFSSFEEFKRILFPLLKLELWASIEQEYRNRQILPFENIKFIPSSMELKAKTVTFMCSYYAENPRNKINFNVGDLCILKFGESFYIQKYFTYIRCIYKRNFHQNDIHYEIVLEVQNTSNVIKLLKETKELQLKSITLIKVELGAFNAIYSLKYSPLLKNIINPFENIKTNNNHTIDNVRYKGYDVLNDNQKDVLLKTYIRNIDNKNPTITLIEGPPGTGKSRIITNLSMQLLYGNEIKMLKKKILICSQSNTAIDVICTKLLHIRKHMSCNRFNLIRYGVLERMHINVRCVSVQQLVEQRLKKQHNQNEMKSLNEEKLMLEAKILELKNLNTRNSVNFDELQEYSKRVQMIERLQNNQLTPENEKDLYPKYIQGAHIICTTLSSAIKLLQCTKDFDICIIDEATQCTEQLSLIPLQFRISSLVLVGDTQQLPATVLSKEASNYGLGRSLFTRIQNCIGTQKNDCSLILTEQYRMHPEISYWPNSYFYNNRLKNANIKSIENSPIQPYTILNLNYTQNSNDKNGQISNTLEAKFVIQIILSISKYLPPKQYQYGIITPYAQHRDNLIKMLREHNLNEILVNTIDSYQGKEKDVIIISNARTKGVGFLGNPQRLNVALTRAKRCLILCGNFSNVERIPAWKSLLDDAKRRNVFYNVSESDAENIDRRIPKRQLHNIDQNQEFLNILNAFVKNSVTKMTAIGRIYSCNNEFTQYHMHFDFECQ